MQKMDYYGQVGEKHMKAALAQGREQGHEADYDRKRIIELLEKKQGGSEKEA